MFDPVLAHLVEEGMVFAAAIIGIVAVGVITLARQKARRPVELGSDALERRLDEIATQLNHLQLAVEASSVEIERISEGQRFTTKLLAERTAQR